MEEVEENAIEDALISITSEGGTTWSLSDELAVTFSFKPDILSEYSKRKRADGNRTSYVHLLFGRPSGVPKDAVTHYHCGVEGCSAKYKKADSGSHLKSMKTHSKTHHSSLHDAAESFIRNLKGKQGKLKFSVEKRAVKFSEEEKQLLLEIWAGLIGSSAAAENFTDEPLLELFVYVLSRGQFELPTRQTVSAQFHHLLDDAVEYVNAEYFEGDNAPHFAHLQWDGWSSLGKEEQMCLALSWLDPHTFEFKSARVGAPFVDGDVNAPMIWEAVDSFMKSKFGEVWAKTYSCTNDNARVAMAAGRADAMHRIACFMHSLELSLKDGEKQSKDASAAFAAQRALASFIHRSRLGRYFWLLTCEEFVRLAERKPLPQTAATTRYFTTADQTVFLTTHHDAVQSFILKIKANEHRFAIDPSFIRRKKKGRATANKKFYGEHQTEFLRAIAPTLQFMTHRERMMCVENDFTQPFVPYIIKELRDHVSVRLQADEVNRVRSAKGYLKGLQSSLDNRFWLMTDLNKQEPAAYMPMMFAPHHVMLFKQLVPQEEQENVLSLLKETITASFSAPVVEVAAVDNPFADFGYQHRHEGGIQGAEELANAILGNYFAAVAAYHHVHAETLESNPFDTELGIRNFWLSKNHISQDWYAPMRSAALQWLCVTATQAATERMGSIGTFLGGGRRAGVSEDKLETRMDLRFLKSAVYDVLRAKCVDAGLLEPDPASKRRK